METTFLYIFCAIELIVTLILTIKLKQTSFGLPAYENKPPIPKRKDFEYYTDLIKEMAKELRLIYEEDASKSEHKKHINLTKGPWDIPIFDLPLCDIITLDQFKSVFEYIDDEQLAIKLNEDEIKSEYNRFFSKNYDGIYVKFDTYFARECSKRSCNKDLSNLPKLDLHIIIKGKKYSINWDSLTEINDEKTNK